MRVRRKRQQLRSGAIANQGGRVESAKADGNAFQTLPCLDGIEIPIVSDRKTSAERSRV